MSHERNSSDTKEKELDDFVRMFNRVFDRGRGADISERNLQALDFAYGTLALSSNHKPVRSVFKKLAQERGVVEKDFERWANDKTWGAECPICQDTGIFHVQGEGFLNELFGNGYCPRMCTAAQNAKKENALKREIFSCDWCSTDSAIPGSIQTDWSIVDDTPTTPNSKKHLCADCSTARSQGIEYARHQRLEQVKRTRRTENAP